MRFHHREHSPERTAVDRTDLEYRSSWCDFSQTSKYFRIEFISRKLTLDFEEKFEVFEFIKLMVIDIWSAHNINGIEVSTCRLNQCQKLHSLPFHGVFWYFNGITSRCLKYFGFSLASKTENKRRSLYCWCSLKFWTKTMKPKIIINYSKIFI